MKTQTETLAIIKELQTIPHITVSYRIQKSISDRTIIGVNIQSSSVIRKQSFTIDFMQKYCQDHGFTLVDNAPATKSLQIFFN